MNKQELDQMQEFWRKDIYEIYDIRDVREMACTDISNLIKEIRELRQDKLTLSRMTVNNTKEFEKLQEALKFYADEKNHDWSIDYFDNVNWSKVMEDEGELARKVLGEVK